MSLICIASTLFLNCFSVGLLDATKCSNKINEYKHLSVYLRIVVSILFFVLRLLSIAIQRVAVYRGYQESRRRSSV